MSQNLHPVKLSWSTGRGGVARWYDVAISLPPENPPALPIVPRLAIELVEWIPTLGVAYVRETGYGPRDLKPTEIEACKAYLQMVCDPAHSTPESRLP